MTRVPIERREFVPQAALPRAGRGRVSRRVGGVRTGRQRVRRAGGPREQKGNTSVTTMDSAEPTRRDFLYIATGAVGAIGAAATLVPLIAQMNPDASTIAAGAPIEIDLAPIAEGQVIKVFWRSK